MGALVIRVISDACCDVSICAALNIVMCILVNPLRNQVLLFRWHRGHCGGRWD